MNNQKNKRLFMVACVVTVSFVLAFIVHHYILWDVDDINLAKRTKSLYSYYTTTTKNDGSVNQERTSQFKKMKTNPSLVDTFFICINKLVYFLSLKNKGMEKIENEVKTKEETKIYFYLSEEKMKEMEAKIYQSVIFSMNQIMIRELENLKSKIDEEVGRKIEANRPTVQTILQTKEVVVREIDYDVFNKLIDDAIIKYDADKTNLVDFALDSTGGHILEASGDLSFWEHSEWEEAWQHPIAYFLKPSPSVVIQRTTNTLIPGNGWCFKGNAGFVTIGLSYPIKIDSLTYEHIHISNSPSNSISSAPKQIEILGMMTYPTTNKTKSLGNFTFINIGKSIQTFQIKTATEETFPIAQIKIKSNYGANYTCLYRLRVHGKMTGSH